MSLIHDDEKLWQFLFNVELIWLVSWSTFIVLWENKLHKTFIKTGASAVAQLVNSPPAVQKTQDTWVHSLGEEDLLEKGMATHSSILAWRIPWTEELGKLQSLGLQNWTRLSN